MSREPFTRDQLAYIERTALRAMRVWNRAMRHLDRIGAHNHELYRARGGERGPRATGSRHVRQIRGGGAKGKSHAMAAEVVIAELLKPYADDHFVALPGVHAMASQPTSAASPVAVTSDTC